MIGIIGAMDEEIALLEENIEVNNREEVAGILFVEGSLFDQPVVLLKSGIGKVNAAMATTILHERYNIDSVINTGSAGGFANDLEVGDVVISSYVTHHDVDVTAFQYEYGQVPGMPAMYEADQQLISQTEKALEASRVKAARGIIATGDSFMQDQERVRFVRSKFPDMIAAEMEAAAVAQVCHKYGTPFVVVRALSDIAGKESNISFEQFLTKAAENAATMIMNMVRSM